jgi:ubiquinol-cytochrome c reductase iron-sulfur subunit
MGKKNHSERRSFLFTATYTMGAVGVGAAIWPLVDQMNPDSSVKALSTTEVDISGLEFGKTITVLWRGKPILI